ncbi:MAG: alpha/beta hydrolase [Pseudomonadota bacterium]
MTGFLSRLATRIDTGGAKARMRQFREGWPAGTSPEIRFHETAKVQFRYRQRGEGQTLVFAADPPVTLEAYDELLEIFAPHYRVIIVELPAMGFSATRTSYQFGWHETNDEVAAFLRAVAGPGAVLAFSCVAGLASVDVAVRYPELVKKLVLLQTADIPALLRWKVSRDPRGLLGTPFLGQWGMKRMAPGRVGDWMGLAVGKEEQLAPLCGCASTSLDHGALWALASAFQNYLHDGVTVGVPRQPILAIWGLSDDSHPDEHADSTQNYAPNVRTEKITDLGHFPELEDPARIFPLINGFIQER